jgi:hypothetical protein
VLTAVGGSGMPLQLVQPAITASETLAYTGSTNSPTGSDAWTIIPVNCVSPTCAESAMRNTESTH